MEAANLLYFIYPLPWDVTMNNNQKKEVVHRIKIIQGHTRKILSMVEENAYCMDVLHQARAVGAALERVEDVILENHLRTCVKESLKNAKTEEKVIGELLDAYKASH